MAASLSPSHHDADFDGRGDVHEHVHDRDHDDQASGGKYGGPKEGGLNICQHAFLLIIIHIIIINIDIIIIIIIIIITTGTTTATARPPTIAGAMRLRVSDPEAFA